MKQSPNWKTNLFVFAAIITSVCGYFFWQTQYAYREYLNHLLEHSKTLATVIEHNIRNALLSKSGLEDIVANSLENSARFIHFLNSAEPFSSAELTAFALESGLAGIKIIKDATGSAVSGPANWLSDTECKATTGLEHLEAETLYLFSFSTGGNTSVASDYGCVLVGVSAHKMNTLLEAISVNHLLSMLRDFKDIAYIRVEMEYPVLPDNRILTSERIRLGRPLETVISIGEKKIIVALKTDRLAKRIQQTRQEFVIFVIFLVMFGGLSSLWLYRVQRQRLQQTRDFERKMARQHEDAALGRAAATLTHELQNPLNAVGMGLQRLQIEALDLDLDHHKLVVSMLSAVARTNIIISRLRQYIHSFEVVRHPVDLADLVNQVLVLYRSQCEKQHIEIELDCDQKFYVLGDKDLLGKLFENLLKNSVEAQPLGGFLKISISQCEKSCLVEIVNGGFLLTEEQSKLLFEPYFTTKSKGTGLGLVISHKIIQAHEGHLDWKIDSVKKSIRFMLKLPMAKNNISHLKELL